MKWKINITLKLVVISAAISIHSEQINNQKPFFYLTEDIDKEARVHRFVHMATQTCEDRRRRVPFGCCNKMSNISQLMLIRSGH